MREHITLNAGEHAGPKTVVENAVAAGGLVDEGEGGQRGGGAICDACVDEVRPAVVLVGVAAAAVGDAVAYYGECAVGGWGPGFDGGEEVPFIYVRIILPGSVCEATYQ